MLLKSKLISQLMGVVYAIFFSMSTFIFGGYRWTRTTDMGIMNAVFYRLNYITVFGSLEWVRTTDLHHVKVALLTN